MNGVHDMGGMHCHGPVTPERDEPVFHAEWERRALAITLAVGCLGQWNIDQARASRESLPPATYLSSSYYEIWVRALENSLRELSMLDEPRTGLRAQTWDEVAPALEHGTPYDREPAGAARYAVGDKVRTRSLHPAGHTRLPWYARGKRATVVLVHGAYVFPDRNAVPLGERPDKTPEWLYTIEFEGSELWGEESEPGLRVSIDAWEPYLEVAS